MMRFQVPGRGAVHLDFAAAVIAGFTGRDELAVRRHVDELAAAGIAAPARLPSFYALPASVLTQADTITVVHPDTSGEAEIVLLLSAHGTFVTVGSDHTDRAAEAKDIALAKGACPKVLAKQAWPYDEVASHWDRLEVRSWIHEGGRRVPYQRGVAGSIMAPEQLHALVPYDKRPETCAIFCGTFAADGGIRPSPHFSATLSDPVTGRSISLSYSILQLDVLLDDQVDRQPSLAAADAAQPPIQAPE